MKHAFLDIQVDMQCFEVHRGAESVVLPRRAFDVLAYLIEHRDRAVSRSELLDACWPDAVVSDGSLSTCIADLRRSLGDTGRSGRIIRTLHGRGYQFIAPLDGVQAEAAPSGETLAPSADPLHGREWLSSQLRERLKAAQQSQGSLLWLQGEPGMGKSSLAAATTSMAAAQSMLSLSTAASRMQGTPSLWPWLQLMRALATKVDRDTLKAAAGRNRSWLSEWTPHLAEVLGPASPLPALEAPERRFRMLDAMLQLVLRLSVKQPMLLVFDDLQWADVDTLEALELLASQLSEAAVCVLALYRPTTTGSLLGRTIEGLRRVHRTPVLVLEPLDPRAAASLVRGAAGDDLEEEDLAAVVERGRGNPLFLVELARFAAAEGRVDGAVPDGIRSLVERRLARLSPETSLVVRAAAVLGNEIDPAVLAFASGQSDEAVRDAMATASAHYLVQSVRGLEGYYTFAHELIREAVYGSTPPRDRRLWHARAADYLERSLSRAPASKGLLGYHLAEAGQSSRAAALTVDAAAEAYSRGAHRTASELACRVLSSHGEQLDEVERARLLLERARGLVAAGAPFFVIRESYTQAISTGVGERSPHVLAETVLEGTGFGIFSGTSRRQGYCAPIEIEAVERALACVPANSVWHPLVAAWLANLWARSSLHCAKAEALADEAVHLAYAIGEPRIVCATLLARASVLCGPDHYHTRLGLAGQALELAEELGHPALRIEAHAQWMAARLSRGEECEVGALRIEAIAAEVQVPSLAVTALHWRVGRALAAFDLSAVRQLSDRAHELSRNRNALNATLSATAVELHVRMAQGNLGNWRQVIEATSNAEPDNEGLRAALLGVLVSRGELEAARPLLDHLTRRLAELRAHVDWAVMLSICARAAAGLASCSHAREVQALYAPYEDLWVTETGDLLLWIGPAAYDLALLARCLGQHAEAERLFDKAQTLCERLGARGPQLLVETQRVAHRMACGADSPGQASKALHALRERARSMDYAAQVREIDALLAAGHSPSTSRCQPANPS